MGLEIPKGKDAEIQTVKGVQYLVYRLDSPALTCPEYAEVLQRGQPVVVPTSKRNHLVGLLKEKNIFARSKSIDGKWVLFTPCAPREFKP